MYEAHSLRYAEQAKTRLRRIHHRTNGRCPGRAGRAGAQDVFDAATCIGCGACVAACPNGSAAAVPGRDDHPPGRPTQGQAERRNGALAMIDQHDAEGLGGCTQIGECTALCPKGIQLDVISRHRDVLSALVHRED